MSGRQVTPAPWRLEGTNLFTAGSEVLAGHRIVGENGNIVGVVRRIENAELVILLRNEHATKWLDWLLEKAALEERIAKLERVVVALRACGFPIDWFKDVENPSADAAMRLHEALLALDAKP